MRPDGEMSSKRKLAGIKGHLVHLFVLSALAGVTTPSLTTQAENLFIQTVSNRFAQAPRSELLNIWHTDCHRRCRYQITSHVEVACQYDPYRIIQRPRRSPRLNKTRSAALSEVHVSANLTTPNMAPEAIEMQQRLLPFLAKTSATSFLRYRRAAISNPLAQGMRRQKRDVNIVEECCFTKACAWEEYAEYCQGHARRASERNSVCSYS